MRLPASRSPVWVLLETATSALFSLGSMLLISRVIGPDATGTAMIAVAAFLLLDVAGASLFTDAVVRIGRLEQRHAATAITGATLVGAAAGLLLAIAGPWLARGADAPLVASLCLALAPLLPVSAFSGAASGLILREHRFALLALRVLLGAPLALTVGLAMAAGGVGPWAIVANQAVATLTAFVLVAAFGRLRVGPKLDRAALREMWPVAAPQVLAVFVMVGKYRVFLLALGFLAAEAVVAVCHVAFRMLDAALVVVWQAGARIGMARLCALQDDREAMAEAYGDLAQLMALLGLPLSLGIALTAPDLVHALLGPEWREAATAAQVVGLAACVTFLQGDFVSLFVAAGKAHRNLAYAAIFMAIPLAALIVFQPATPLGIALCWAAQSLAMPIVLLPPVLKLVRRSPLWLLGRIWPALLAAGCMAGAVLGVQAALTRPPAQELAAASVLGAAVYLGVAWLALGGQPPVALRRRGLRPVPAE
ncbi:MAG TPA: oligosaccharide flippase family protein [Acetobacteraceae bacterium]|nr:oligosaccharide flippase family protein [Acetobacteraceae bacterium]